jgi:hypothetical protein
MVLNYFCCYKVGLHKNVSLTNVILSLLLIFVINLILKFRISLNLQGNSPIRHVETCPDFFFTARVHARKSNVKILAANTHCKYFLKIAEVTHFFCTRNRFTRGLYNPLCCLISRPLQHSPRLRQPCCMLHTALPCLGSARVHISPTVWQVTILAMFSNF